MTFDTLLTRASVNTQQRAMWFSSATLTGNSLLVADAADHDCIQRCFLPALVAVLPGLVLTFSPSSARREAPKAKTTQPALKKSYYTGRARLPVQGDML